MHDSVREYYGQTLQSTEDLKTTACCDASEVPAWLRPLLGKIHPEVTSRYYGCGLVCPVLLEGCRVLDLGCGSGRDAYALAQLVGPTGEVVGVDMTPEQISVAERHRSFHAERFGYANAIFREGYIEQLDALDLEPESFDVIVSNCVINLSPDKDAVLRGISTLLRPGGEFYFADVYADQRVPERVRNDPVLYGECLGGALYWNDFNRLARAAGFLDPRLVTDRALEITDASVAGRVTGLRYFSATYRLFKLQGLESSCEDYGQVVVYRGTIEEYPDRYVFDKHHSFETGRSVPVCGNTWRMLRETRFCSHFEFIGDFSGHRGLFEGCGDRMPFDLGRPSSTAAACC